MTTLHSLPQNLTSVTDKTNEFKNAGYEILAMRHFLAAGLGLLSLALTNIPNTNVYATGPSDQQIIGVIGCFATAIFTGINIADTVSSYETKPIAANDAEKPTVPSVPLQAAPVDLVMRIIGEEARYAALSNNGLTHVMTNLPKALREEASVSEALAKTLDTPRIAGDQRSILISNVMSALEKKGALGAVRHDLKQEKQPFANAL